jgi:hypothetical protein
MLRRLHGIVAVQVIDGQGVVDTLWKHDSQAQCVTEVRAESIGTLWAYPLRHRLYSCRVAKKPSQVLIIKTRLITSVIHLGFVAGIPDNLAVLDYARTLLTRITPRSQTSQSLNSLSFLLVDFQTIGVTS